MIGTILKITIFVNILLFAHNFALAAPLIAIDGSSTVYPITEAVAEEFRNVDRDIRITVGISGSGGGFKKFCRGETDISDASRPIKAKEIKLCAENGIEFIELPVAYDGLAVVINPQNNWAETITVSELKKCGNPLPREILPDGAKFVRVGRIKKSIYLVPEWIQGHLITLLKQ